MDFSIPFKIADAHCDFITKYHGGMSIMNPFNAGQHITLKGMKKSNINPNMTVYFYKYTGI